MSSAAFAAATRGRRKPLHSSASLNRTELAHAATTQTSTTASSVYAATAFPDYAQLTREAEAFEAARHARDARLVADASSLIITFPGSALRELDTWCARLQMLTCALSTASEFSVAHAALRQQLVDATAFALKWQETRACAGTLIESVVGLDVDSRARLQATVDKLVQGWRARASAFNWAYRRTYVYKLGRPVAELVGSLHTVLEEFACEETADGVRAIDEDACMDDCDAPQSSSGSIDTDNITLVAPVAPCAELLPAALRLATDAIHDAALAEGLALSIRMAVVVFANATVTITAAGLELHTRVDVTCAPRMMLQDGPAISARAYVPVALPHGGADAVGFDAGLLADKLLPLSANVFPLLGALLRPAWLRGADLRPVFVLATSPPDVTHAVVWAMHTFGGFAVTRTLSGTDTDTHVPDDDEPYILFIDAKLRELTVEDTCVIARALARRMAVVVAANAVPAVLYETECEYLRLALCHVRVDMPMCSIKHQVVCEQLLFACTTAYAMQRHTTALSFISTNTELVYRLDYSSHRRLVPTLLMEMFQSGLGLRLAAGKTCSIRAVDAVLTLYHERRCPDDMMRPECSAEDVLAAAAAFRQYFGSYFDFEPLVYDSGKTIFLNLQATE